MDSVRPRTEHGDTLKDALLPPTSSGRLGGGSAIVWGGRSWDAHTDLYVVSRGHLRSLPASCFWVTDLPAPQA